MIGKNGAGGKNDATLAASKQKYKPSTSQKNGLVLSSFPGGGVAQESSTIPEPKSGDTGWQKSLCANVSLCARGTK